VLNGQLALVEEAALGGRNEHHGVGLKLGSYLKDLYGTAMPVLEDIKKIMDPNNIMNPGKMGFKGM
jgi:alkyldihydroxyacetonephosphate synthase